MVAWNMHFPEQQFQDDNGNSNLSGPYDTTPGVPPAAMSWFSRTDRPTNEIKEIASVSGNTITFTSPLSIGYRTSHSAQLTRYTATGVERGNSVQVTNAGVENLTMYGGADGELRFESAAYSWAKNIEVTQWIGEGFAINNSFRIEVRDSYIHTGSWPEPGGAGYIISFADGSSEVLIENNILIDACKEMVFRSSGAGSVVAYNYADDSWDFDNPTWVEVGLNASHMAGPHHVLFEGNYSQNFDSDYTHGNAIYLTVFRNWLSGQRRSFTDTSQCSHRRAGLRVVVGHLRRQRSWPFRADERLALHRSLHDCDAFGSNCSGNVANWSEKDIWKLGYDPERWGMVADPQTLSTVIRDGNYDFLTNSQRWHNTPGGFAIPNSMYLTSKPAFFGSNPWPWVDPTTGTISPFLPRHGMTPAPPIRSRIRAATRLRSVRHPAMAVRSPAAAHSRRVVRTPSPQLPTAATRSPTGPRTARWSAPRRVTPSRSRRTATWSPISYAVNYTIALSASPSAGGTVDRQRHIRGGHFTHRDGDSQQRLHVRELDREQHGGQHCGELHFHAHRQPQPGRQFHRNPVNYTIALSASPSAGGTVSGSGTFTAGTSRTVTATANSGYTFTNWTENGTVVSTAASYTFTLTGNRNLVANFTNVATDFSGDGVSDILFRNNATGDTGFYQMNSNGTLQGWHGIGGSSTAYAVVGVGDFNGDGILDILFRNNATGDIGFYQMNSNGTLQGWHGIGGSSTAYAVVGVGDFNGDGVSDILLRNNATGDTGFYQMNSNGTLQGWHGIGGSSTAYNVVGVGDFNGDGVSDILFRNNATGDTGFYQMNSNGTLQGWHGIGGSSTAYNVVGVGDFNGDGVSDILFRNNATGDTGFYQMNSNGTLQGSHGIGGSSTAYAVVGTGDYNGDGVSDILFRNNATGDTGFYQMNSNGTLQGWHSIGGSSTAYSVVPPS